MQIAIYGTGAIGSTFAFYLARTAHEVTVIARGKRLEQLQADEGVLLTSGERAKVKIAAALDPAIPYDLVLVTVLATQVEAILPALKSCSARKIMFMFNTFRSIEPLREAAGSARCAFGFPGGVFTILDKRGRITPQVRSGNTTSDPAWATAFTACGIPTSVEPDMQGYLRSHAALVYPLMAIGVLVLARGAGITWAEARLHAEAFAAGMRIVREVGSAWRPGFVARLAGMPRWLLTAFLWLLSRTKTIRDLGILGPTEARMIGDMMTSEMPHLAASLAAIRPASS